MLMSTNERNASALSKPALSSANVSARTPGRLESDAPAKEPARPGTRAKTRHMKPVRPYANPSPERTFFFGTSILSTLSRA